MACGESGSNPPELPEVHFFFTGAGTVTVDSIAANGVAFPSIAGNEFTTTSTLDFVIENAGPAYVGTFTQTAGDPMIGTLFLVRSAGASGGDIRMREPLVPIGTPVTLVSVLDEPPTTAIPATSEVRIQVCSPQPGKSSCFTPDDVGVPGIPFGGSIGDGLTSRLLGGVPPNNVVSTSGPVTPAVYFYANALYSINGVFRSGGGQTLVVQLFVNGAAQQTTSGDEDVIIQKDL